MSMADHQKVKSRMNLELVRLPPVMLDWLGPDYITRDELSLRGYDLPCYPSICRYTLKYPHINNQ